MLDGVRADRGRQAVHRRDAGRGRGGAGAARRALRPAGVAVHRRVPAGPLRRGGEGVAGARRDGDRRLLRHDAGHDRGGGQGTRNALMAGGRVRDAIVVGGGHNGLVAAAYLAKAGLDVLVLERRDVLGGAAVTEELWPGYRVSTAAYLISLLQEKVVRDLDLKRHGYQILPKDP